jgi:ubiquinone/menaquinone biosynthesis C-methylase UbiE
MELPAFDRSRPLKIADVGCGTSASTILLASELDADASCAAAINAPSINKGHKWGHK